MIVGISGLAGSGKDTAADFLVKNHNFVRIGLADHIKRICKDVFDFTDEQLWGPSTLRNTPDERYLFKRYNISHMLTEEGKKLLDEDGFLPNYLTPRHALQQLGTEWGRHCYENVWIEGALRTAQKLLVGQHLLDGAPAPEYSPQRGLYYDRAVVPEMMEQDDEEGISRRFMPVGVVFSDLRFKNEFAAVRKAGSRLWRMKRGEGLGGTAAQHQSEAEQLEVPDDYFDIVIENTSISLEDLEKRVSSIVGLVSSGDG